MGYIGNQTSNSYTSLDKQVITGDGGASYTLDHAVANENELEVFVNNVRQEPSVAYTVSGTALTMTGNVAAADDFYVVFQGKAIQTVTPPSSSVTTDMIVNDAVTTAKIADDAVTTAKTDFYSTGTWTPVIEGSTSAGTGTYTVQAGNYVKIGQLVYFQLYLGWTAHTGTGNLNHNLPFTVSNQGTNYPPCSVHTGNISLSSNHYCSASVLNELDYGQLKQYPIGGGNQANVPMDTSGTLLISGTYLTD